MTYARTIRSRGDAHLEVDSNGRSHLVFTTWSNVTWRIELQPLECGDIVQSARSLLSGTTAQDDGAVRPAPGAQNQETAAGWLAESW